MYNVKAFSLNNDGDIHLDPATKFFKVKEFACQDGSDTVFINMDLIPLLVAGRIQFGPCTVTSGYRNDAHNASVGGAVGSVHCYGGAADVKFRHGTPIEWYTFYDTIYTNGIGLGVYSGHIHVDCREEKARWDSR